MEKLRKTLILWYYGAFVLAVFAATLGYFCVTRQWFVVAPKTQANTMIYTFVILYVIVTTPLILKWFSRVVERLRAVPDVADKYRRYGRVAKVRLVVVMLGLLASLFFYYVLCEQSLLWLAGISAIALYFCKPTRAKVEQDLSDEQNQNIENQSVLTDN
ncbi:MAG: hypothetical protein ACI392_08690 [Paludibacteraceae bacterium]